MLILLESETFVNIMRKSCDLYDSINKILILQKLCE